MRNGGFFLGLAFCLVVGGGLRVAAKQGVADAGDNNRSGLRFSSRVFREFESKGEESMEIKFDHSDLLRSVGTTSASGVKAQGKSEQVQAQALPVDSFDVSSAKEQENGNPAKVTVTSDGKKQITFQFDSRGCPEFQNVGLKGSFNTETGAFDPHWNGDKITSMHDDGKNGDEKAGDGIYTATVELKAGQKEQFSWGVVGDVKGKDGVTRTNQWLVMTDDNPTFNLDDPDVQTYAPIQTHLFGVHKDGENGVRFQTWSPELAKGDLSDYRLYVEVTNPQTGEVEELIPMNKNEQNGVWSVTQDGGWDKLKGKTYQYAALDSKGQVLKTKWGGEVRYSDPHARYLQGEQRGVERIFVDPVMGFETGWYDDSGKGGPNYADNPQWGRFTVDSHPNADSVRLVLRDENGNQLNKEQLLARLGEPKRIPYDQASPADKHDVDVLRSWKLDQTEPIDKYSWINGVNEDGSIDMTRVESPGAGVAWVTAVNNFQELTGMQYEFQVVEDGKLVGDLDGDGKLSDAERMATPFNDPYTNIIQARPGSARKSMIRESSFEFQYDNVPRRQTDSKNFVIYEAHVGSFMSSKDNAVPTTFEDMIANLDYFASLGVDTIELMPTNEFGGKRDWGYTPDFYYAGADTYGFEMDRQAAIDRKLITDDEQPGAEKVWISGTDALKLFVDESHKRGFNVMADVVYNHTSGRPDADNPLGRIDGDKDSFFNWYQRGESYTPWGAKPNFGNQSVKDFYSDNAVQQVQEFGFDGIRFDFTQVLHTTGNKEEQIEGMETLRQINRTLRLVKPDVYTVAEDFSYSWLVAADQDKSEWQGYGNDSWEKKGMGFSAVWNDRFHDDLLEMSQGIGSADRLMEAITGHVGVTDWSRAVTYAHSHDEVGNTGNWIHRGAAASKDDEAVKQPFPRAIARTASAITLTGPGVPMLFQGEEYLANNDFKHGLTSTWGTDMSWMQFPVTPDKLDDFAKFAAMDVSQREIERSRMSPEDQKLFDKYCEMNPEQKAEAEDLANQAGQFAVTRDLIALRRTSPAFSATGNTTRVYTHNDDRVLAWKRDDGGKDEFVVVSNFANTDRSGYRMELPPGQWKEVFNSNARCYGGTGTGNGGGVLSSNGGIFLPAGSTIVLKKQ
ncbi:alpha amylase C-terminal domain-containing protein [bacterium]|nr:alpha amylase C-terminal domain-containing protein [bacterium]